MKITLITGNKGKIDQWRRLVPLDIEIEHIDMDLDEIQSTDSKKIVSHKVKQAYEITKRPVVIEDVSAGLDDLNGLPGPLIKYFIEALGEDALYKLAKAPNSPAKAKCVIAYFDGNKLEIFEGSVKGMVVSARGENGFGFDKVFQPDGSSKTYGEMSEEEKDKISHRSKAVHQLIEYLKNRKS